MRDPRHFSGSTASLPVFPAPGQRPCVVPASRPGRFSGCGAGLLLRWAAALCLSAGLAGCSTHATRQVDRRPDGTEITTRARSLAFMAGKSALRDVKISQTGKTQGMSLGQSNQESDATSLTQAVGAIVVQGLAAYLTGGASTLGAGGQSPAALPMSLGAWTVPAGMKAVQRGSSVVLVPADDPSTPVPEIAVPPSTP